ncbi:uncharacterized protein EV422DRAFT_522647 [Fimicolochytrium jonesii]|uniref:uncharacterized protein n=1 Tax=Fimicolochytrium jonesii TaxID=1396493 RepID=UPI0022FF0AEB|nr:uncharacterized protein EV422DRAFT_522647 [Fimicolochytrium jonesii]KAI8822910.1 hypothetical protein EV422DRAFT_522647 [Fimicolochytrium jonesii]
MLPTTKDCPLPLCVLSLTLIFPSPSASSGPFSLSFIGLAPLTPKARRSQSRTTSGVLKGSSAKPWDRLDMLFFLGLMDQVEDVGDDRIYESTMPGPEGRTYAAKLQLLSENPFEDEYAQLEQFIEHVNPTCDGLFDMKMTMVVGDVP